MLPWGGVFFKKLPQQVAGKHSTRIDSRIFGHAIGLHNSALAVALAVATTNNDSATIIDRL
jgi:hypothetical protein